MKNLLLITLVSLLCLPPATNSQTLSRQDLERLFDPIFTSQLEKLHIPGAAISVVQDGKVVFAKGYGLADIEKKTPVVPDQTIFRIGSITKVFTAVAVLQMAERGKLKLTDDVNKYLKGFRVPDTFSQPITFADLLTHTSGLDEITPGRHSPDESKIVPLGDFLKTRIVRQFPPGEIISYSTYNPALAAYAVEEIAGTPFKDLVLKNVFQPLKMERTSITKVQPQYAKFLATGYVYAKGDYTKLPFEHFNTYPASDINSTVTDMALFMIAQLGNGQPILSERSVREMQRSQFRNHPDIPGWAYGFYEGELNGLHFVEHGGSMDDGYSALLTLIPQKRIGIFIACNTEGGAEGLAEAAKMAFFDKYFPATVKPELPKTPNPDPASLQVFAGKYKSVIYCHTCAEGTAYNPVPFEVKVTNDGMLSFLNGKWKQVGPMLFVLADGPRMGKVLFGFKKNSKGELAYMFYDSYHVFERVPQ